MKLEATELFGALANDTRLRCLMLLHQDELCVCELTHGLGASQPHVSRHLAPASPRRRRGCGVRCAGLSR